MPKAGVDTIGRVQSSGETRVQIPNGIFQTLEQGLAFLIDINILAA